MIAAAIVQSSGAGLVPAICHIGEARGNRGFWRRLADDHDFGSIRSHVDDPMHRSEETVRRHVGLDSLDEAVHHPFFAGLVEENRELVAVHVFDASVAEFEVKHAVTDRV